MGKLPSSLTICWGCYQGGVETVLLNRLTKLSELDANAHAYFYYSGKGIENFGLIPHAVSDKKKDFRTYIKRHKFDCITFINTLHNLEELKNMGYRGAVLFEFHGFHPTIMKALRQINNGEDYGLVKAVSVPSEYVASIARSALWRRKDVTLSIVRNTIDTRLFHKQSSLNFQQEYKIDPAWLTGPVIGWVGRICPEKNWRDLLRIFRAVKKSRPRMKLLMAGDLTVSPETDLFLGKVNEYKLNADVKVLGNLPYRQMPYFYSFISDTGGALLSTSYSEGYPYHVLEAQACECPVVCSNIGGSTEAISHASTGFVFGLDNYHQAVEYLEELFSNQSVRAEIVQAAREQVLMQCDLSSNTKDYLNWLSTL